LGADLSHDPADQRDGAFVLGRLPACGFEELDAESWPPGEAHDVDRAGDTDAEHAGAGDGECEASGAAEVTHWATARHGALREDADALAPPQVVDGSREGGEVAAPAVDRDLTHAVEHPAHRRELPERRFRQCAYLATPHWHSNGDRVHALS
jgi:hypothetical protein